MTKEEVNQLKILTGILALIFGSIGIHKFILGSKVSSAYTTTGIIMLAVTLLTCGIGAGVMQIISVIEGIIYLTKSDDEFEATYLNPDQPHCWF